MILKCIDGPMDGATYNLSKLPSEPSTNRKPDGFWFDEKDEHGRNVQEQYAFERSADGGNHVTMCYRYTGKVVDTGIAFDTEPASKHE